MVLWKISSTACFETMTESLLDLLLILSTAAHLEGKELYIQDVAKEYFTVRTIGWTANQVNRLAIKYHNVEVDPSFKYVRYYASID